MAEPRSYHFWTRIPTRRERIGWFFRKFVMWHWWRQTRLIEPIWSWWVNRA